MVRPAVRPLGVQRLDARRSRPPRRWRRRMIICTLGRNMSRQQRSIVARPVHVAGQMVELVQVGVLAAQRLDHTHAGDVFVVCAGDLCC